MGELIPVVGLEVHLQLNTKSKVFCGCANATPLTGTLRWQAEPNTHTCPVCLGLPGALPVINRRAIEAALKMALALNCQVNRHSFFERKNYFYPDLPKGYQISQKAAPIGCQGYLEVGGQRVDIWEIHLEEDTAKSVHRVQRDHIKNATLIDFNKSGIPLVEIVSAPAICSVELLDEYAKEVREIARSLGISDGDMEKGQMRFEANISVGQKSAVAKGQLPDYRVEVKNLNSFKSLRDSVSYEIDRQTKSLENGEKLVQETRGWDIEKRQTFVQREKEHAHDYRYFPEPDLPPLEIDNRLIKKLQSEITELPSQQRNRFVAMGLTPDQAEIMARDKRRQDFVVRLAEEIEITEAVKIVINHPEVMEKSPKEVLADLRQKQEERVKDTGAIERIAHQVIENNPQPVADYKAGKTAALKFLVGQMMKESRGKADPQVAASSLEKLLGD